MRLARGFFSVFLDDWMVYQISDQNIIRNRDDFNLRYIAARKYGIHYMVIDSKLTYPSSGKMSFTFLTGGKDNYIYDGEIKRFNKGVKGLWIITNKNR